MIHKFLEAEKRSVVAKTLCDSWVPLFTTSKQWRYVTCPYCLSKRPAPVDDAPKADDDQFNCGATEPSKSCPGYGTLKDGVLHTHDDQALPIYYCDSCAEKAGIKESETA